MKKVSLVWKPTKHQPAPLEVRKKFLLAYKEGGVGAIMPYLTMALSSIAVETGVKVYTVGE